ncbi:MAG: SDR family oxidoreductase [Rhodobacteraceae bacterium]|nr:SDR family oxidoreductase [Paracoccaceae bacterium]
MKTRVLVLGADGMLGHKLFLGLRDMFEVVGSVRSEWAAVAGYGLFDASNTLFGRDMASEVVLARTLEEAAPQVVVNAIGIVKQRPVSTDVLQSLELNAMLPHRLARLCSERGARLIHMSTDCVFAGTRGGYAEMDVPDATDTYGRTKLLGEVTCEGCLTLRTSIIGLELARFRSLIEWFLRQEGRVPGYQRAIFSGVTTAELTRVIGMLVTDQPELSGLYHVAATPISKFALLRDFAARAGLPVELVPDDSVVIDRSLDGRVFAARTGYTVPSWDRMLEELAGELRAR